MKTMTCVLVLALAGAVGITAIAKSGETNRAAKLATSLQGLKWSIGDAVRAAEAKTGGKAVGTEVEAEKGKAVVEVLILMLGDEKEGTAPRLLEVEVDGTSQAILEIEDEDDDDGDDDGDGEDGDHDQGDDDGGTDDDD